MTFPFSLLAAAFFFFAGVFSAGIGYFVICLIKRKNVRAVKISIFIMSLAMLIGVYACHLVFFRETDFSLLKTTDWIFAGINFVCGILFMIFTKICLLILLPAYLIFSFVAYISLVSVFPRKAFFDHKVESAENRELVVVCHEISPYLLLPMPRIWYELQDTEEKQLNPLYSFMKKNLLAKEHKVTAVLPAADYYPVLYKVNVKAGAVNLEVKAEPEF